jgi:hypothetical protein
MTEIPAHLLARAERARTTNHEADSLTGAVEPDNNELGNTLVGLSELNRQVDDWTPMRSDAAEIEYRFAQSTQRLRELRAQKQNLFDLIRDEVISNNRLARAAKIYNIELEGDDGGDE